MLTFVVINVIITKRELFKKKVKNVVYIGRKEAPMQN